MADGTHTALVPENRGADAGHDRSDSIRRCPLGPDNALGPVPAFHFQLREANSIFGLEHLVDGAPADGRRRPCCYLRLAMYAQDIHVYGIERDLEVPAWLALTSMKYRDRGTCPCVVSQEPTQPHRFQERAGTKDLRCREPGKPLGDGRKQVNRIRHDNQYGIGTERGHGADDGPDNGNVP